MQTEARCTRSASRIPATFLARARGHRAGILVLRSVRIETAFTCFEDDPSVSDYADRRERRAMERSEGVKSGAVGQTKDAGEIATRRRLTGGI